MAANDKYLNYYIEKLTSTLTDCVVRNVSMQANAKITDEILQEQQEKIEELENLVQSIKEKSSVTTEQYVSDIKKMTDELTELRTIKSSYDNVKNEASHVETFRSELVKEREMHQATRNELQTKVNNITNDFNNRINKLTSEHNDRLNKLSHDNSERVNKLNLDNNAKLNDLLKKHKEEIKVLSDKIAYLEMSPAKRKKFDSLNQPVVNGKDHKMEETSKDGGVF